MGITRICLLVDTNGYMHLGACRINGQRTCYNESDKK